MRLLVTAPAGIWRFWPGPANLGVEFIHLEVPLAAISFLLFVLAHTKDDLSRTLAAEEDAPSALQLAQRLREVVASTEFSEGIPVTASFGVTLSCEQGTLVSLIKRADLALYRAKNNGRNRVEWEVP